MTSSNIISLKKRKLNLLREKLYAQYRNIAWMRYHHISTKNKSMTFKDREFLVDIYKAVHTVRKVAIMKSVQCGVSECFIVSHFEQADRGMSVMYILPKIDIRNRFVNFRINGAIVKVALYREIVNRAVNRADSVSLKVFGNGAINYVASNSPVNFTEYPADAVYYDEKDRMDQNTILMAKDRLSDSEYKFERMVSNPTVGEYGISYDFDRSTKGEYFFKCPRCGVWQPYDFFVNVVKETGKRQYEVLDKEWDKELNRDVITYCGKCGKPFNRFDVQREWVHEFNNMDVVGFHVSKMFSPQGNIRDLVDTLMTSKDNESKFQIFLNSDLGLPMVGGGAQITRENVLALRGSYRCGADIKKEGIRYAGIDVGNKLHTVVREKTNDGRSKLIWKGMLSTEKSVLKMMVDFGVSKVVIDALPELRMVENLKNASDAIYSCSFGHIKDTNVSRAKKSVTVQRTLAIDRVKENYDRGVYLNPIDIDDDKDFIQHMMSNVRIVNIESGEFIWVQKANRPDHYLLAEAYCDLAGEIAMGTEIFKFYEDEVKSEVEKEKEAMERVHDEINDLPEKEKKRVEAKKALTANQFFAQLRKQQMEDEVIGDIMGDEY